jgi:hypothetical protein
MLGGLERIIRVIKFKMDQPFYIISNASSDVFPDNTLTEFKNVFPRTLSFPEEEKWEVGIETIGISSMFRNVYTPKAGVPVIIASHDKTNLRHLRQSPVVDPREDWHFSINMNLAKVNNSDAMYTELVDKFYTEADVYSMCRYYTIKLRPYCILSYDGTRMTISYNDHYSLKHKGAWIFLHETFAKSFKFVSHHIKDMSMMRAIEGNNSNKVSLVEIGSNLHLERKIDYNGETYLGYLLHEDKSRELYGSLVSEPIDLYHHDMLPEIIKVQCDIIEPQIINNYFSQDLLILSTDVQYTNNYFFHDIERISYFPLLFNDISQITIRLVDENDKKLELMQGHATIIKLRFKKNKKMIDNFYVRVTSKPNDIYTDNKPYKFRIQLPSTKVLNEDWKVSLNSINIPNKFTTFITPNEQLRSFVYKTADKPSIVHVFKSNVSYTPTLIVAEINTFLASNDVGDATIDNLGRLVINVKEACTLAVGLDAVKVLGYQTALIPMGANYMFIRPLPDNPKTFTFESPINVNYFRPNYFIIYSNIVQPSIIGNIFSPILKIVPIVDAKEAFKLHDFKVREFYNIPNTEINEIQMEIRTHDGEFVNFLLDQHVIMNLQFTNELNPN